MSIHWFCCCFITKERAFCSWLNDYVIWYLVISFTVAKNIFISNDKNIKNCYLDTRINPLQCPYMCYNRRRASKGSSGDKFHETLSGSWTFTASCFNSFWLSSQCCRLPAGELLLVIYCYVLKAKMLFFITRCF